MPIAHRPRGWVLAVNITNIVILPSVIEVSESAHDLVIAHVTALCRAGFYQLRQLHPATSLMKQPGH